MPPPILLSWKAPCTTRRARAASPASTTSDRFSSEEPWAIAMTLIFASASAEERRGAMAGAHGSAGRGVSGRGGAGNNDPAISQRLPGQELSRVAEPRDARRDALVPGAAL